MAEVQLSLISDCANFKKKFKKVKQLLITKQ